MRLISGVALAPMRRVNPRRVSAAHQEPACHLLRLTSFPVPEKRAGGNERQTPKKCSNWLACLPHSPCKHRRPRHPRRAGYLRAVAGDVRAVRQLGERAEALGTVAPLEAVVTLSCGNACSK